jgi:hypothetical protein
MSTGNFSPQKMMEFVHGDSSDADAHWCVALVPEDESATVVFLQGQAVQYLTLDQAQKKADELNERMKGTAAAGGA